MTETSRPDTPATEVLAKMCESAVWLLSAAPTPPRRVRMRCGETVVEAEWVADVAGPGSSGPGAADRPAEFAESRVVHVHAPMVGTFYHAAEPGGRPFVSAGEAVEAGQQVGILESMKLMNPIEVDVTGVVVDILVRDASPVEYDQPLIAIEPSE